MWSDFHQYIDTQVSQRRDGAAKRHRLPHLLAPVRPVQGLARFHYLACHAAHKGKSGRCERHPRAGRFQVIQGRFHQCAVVCWACPQARHPDTLGLKAIKHGLDIRLRAADRLVSAVIRGNAQAYASGCGIVAVHDLRHLRCRRKHCPHRPFSRYRRDQLSAGCREPQSIFQPEHPCRLCRGNFTQAVAHHYTRTDPHTRP